MLVIDGDRISVRAIERSLAQCDYLIEWARDGEAALDILRRVRIDTIVSDTSLVGMSGLDLMQRVTKLLGPDLPLFVFVSADLAVTTRVSLLLAGAVDYVTKPFSPTELRARVRNTIEVRRRVRPISGTGVGGLAGCSKTFAVPDLLTMFEYTRSTGVLRVGVGATTGRLVFRAGRVTHAAIGTLTGHAAFFTVIEHYSGLFQFDPGASDDPVTMEAGISELLLASAVRQDGDEATAMDALRTETGLRELGIVKSPIVLRSRQPSQPPESLVAAVARMEAAISDPVFLGDLVLSSVLVPARPAVRVELWSSIADGLPELLALATPPGYQLLQTALTGGATCVQLQFEAASTMMVTTLVDAEDTLVLTKAPPHMIIVAPPRGELLALAPSRLAELEPRVADGTCVVIAYGGKSLHASMHALAGRLGASHRFRAVPSTGELDLRALLAQACQTWRASR